MSIPSVVLRGQDADERLRQLGLTAVLLRDKLEYGYGFAASCTNHHPLALPGTNAWAYTIAGLRDDLVDLGWTVGRRRNLETVDHPSRSHGIVVTSGNPRAGDPDGDPRTRYKKGEATASAVAKNAQLDFGSIATNNDDALVLGEVDPPSEQTWFLLHHYDRRVEVIRAELSLPDFIEHGWIKGWAERIVLDPIDFSTNVDFRTDDGDDDIDIDVRRRS